MALSNHQTTWLLKRQYLQVGSRHWWLDSRRHPKRRAIYNSQKVPPQPGAYFFAHCTCNSFPRKIS